MISASVGLLDNVSTASQGAPAFARSWVGRTVGWLCLALALGASAPYFSRLMNANERPRLLQAVAVVDHGTWALDSVIARGLDPGIDVADGGRGVFPNKPPGATFPAIVAYQSLRWWHAVGGAAPTLAMLTLLSRLLGAWLPTMALVGFSAARLAPQLGVRGPAAAVLVVLATPLAAYAHVLFGHSLAALCLFVGITWVIDDSFAPVADAGRRGFFGGLVAGSAVIVEYGAAFAAIPLLWLLGRRMGQGRGRWVVTICAGALVPIVLLAAYQTYAFGAPWATGYHHVVDPGFAAIHQQGLLGLTWPSGADMVEDLLSPWGGLLMWAPLVVFSAFGVTAGETDRERTLVKIHVATFATFVLVTLALSQAGGWRVGPRYLVAGLPGVIPALGYGLGRLESRRAWLVALWAVALGSVVPNALAANLFPHLIPQGNPLAELLVPLLELGREPYSVLNGWSGPLPGAVWLPLLCSLGLAFACLWCVTPRAVVLPVAGIGITGAVILVGLIWLRPGSPAGEANLGAVLSIWEPSARPPRRVMLTGS